MRSAGGAQVDVWHSDALGAYSDGAQKFLRGYQVDRRHRRGALRHDLSRRVPGPRGAHPFTSRTAQRAGVHLADLLRRGRHRPVYASAVRRGTASVACATTANGLSCSRGRQLLVTPTPSGAGFATTFDIALSTYMATARAALPRDHVGRIPRRRHRRGDRRLPAARCRCSEADIQPDLDRRAPGQSALVTQRKESDTVQILSGVFEGRRSARRSRSLIPNEDMRPGDYGEVREKYRPSHADYTYDAKYGIRDWRGGGRPARARRPAASPPAPWRASCCAIAYGVEIVAWVVARSARIVADVRRRARDARRGRADADPLPRSRRRPSG